MTRAIDIYQQSDGEVTRAYYAELERRGPVGIIALNLFRAQRCSSRAKVYRGRGSRKWKDNAYSRKNWSLENLSAALNQHATSLFIRYGWKQDSATPAFEWVLYVDLPQLGQVSFHSPVRMTGPDYDGEWDGARQSDNRILTFCDWVMKGCEAEPGPDVSPVKEFVVLQCPECGRPEYNNGLIAWCDGADKGTGQGGHVRDLATTDPRWQPV